jgi:hypothetical protein
MSVRHELRRAAAGDAPIVVGPWLSEVGYEVLYWVPFVRWFADHYHVAPDRLVVVTRGGAAAWYSDLCARHVELFDLFPPDEFAARNRERQASGDQKQLRLSPFDLDILERVRAQLGVPRLNVCHPSAMFRLLRHYWLGTDSLQQVLDHTRYVRLAPEMAERIADLPERYAAVKFYSGPSLPNTPANRAALRAIVERIARQLPIVTLATGLTVDDHEDYLFQGVPGVIPMQRWLTPRDNLAVQTEIIRRASRFVGTCGSLAWLAPMLGTETFAIYADEHFLTPHLYAARQVYQTLATAPFTAVDIRGLQELGAMEAIATPVTSGR